MSILISAAETIATLVAAGYAAHRVENAALARRGYDTRDFFKPLAPPPAPEPTSLDLAWLQFCDAAEAEEERLFRAVPSAWWLDPERWGPRPAPYRPGQTRIRGETPAEPIVVDAPPCPRCPDGGKRTVMAIHDGEATMWDCFVCGCEFTRAGETRTSKKKRVAAAARAAEKAATAEIEHEERRNRAWEHRANQVHAGKAENHGSCPGECGMPVDKRDGMYYCSDSQCKRHTKGWK